MKKFLLILISTIPLFNYAYATTITCGAIPPAGHADVCACPVGMYMTGVHRYYDGGIFFVSAVDCSPVNTSSITSGSIQLFNASKCPNGWLLDKNNNQNYANHLYCKKQ